MKQICFSQHASGFELAAKPPRRHVATRPSKHKPRDRSIALGSTLYKPASEEARISAKESAYGSRHQPAVLVCQTSQQSLDKAQAVVAHGSSNTQLVDGAQTPLAMSPGTAASAGTERASLNLRTRALGPGPVHILHRGLGCVLQPKAHPQPRYVWVSAS